MLDQPRTSPAQSIISMTASRDVCGGSSATRTSPSAPTCGGHYQHDNNDMIMIYYYIS